MNDWITLLAISLKTHIKTILHLAYMYLLRDPFIHCSSGSSLVYLSLIDVLYLRISGIEAEMGNCSDRTMMYTTKDSTKEVHIEICKFSDDEDKQYILADVIWWKYMQLVNSIC